MDRKAVLIAIPLFAISGLLLYEAVSSQPANAGETNQQEPFWERPIWKKMFGEEPAFPFDPNKVIGRGCIRYRPLSSTIIRRVLAYKNIAKKYGDAFGVPYGLILAVIAVESAGNPRAYRYERHLRDASRGLMQMLCSTARKMGLRGSCELLYNPDVSIRYGAKFLRYLHDKLGDWLWAIAAYNAGERVSRYNRYCFRNQLYVDKVVSAMAQLKPYLER